MIDTCKIKGLIDIDCFVGNKHNFHLTNASAQFDRQQFHATAGAKHPKASSVTKVTQHALPWLCNITFSLLPLISRGPTIESSPKSDYFLHTLILYLIRRSE